MNETQAQTPDQIPIGWRRRIGDFLLRVWSMIIILVVACTAWMAVVYMLRYVFTPPQLPAWIRETQPPLSRAADEFLVTAGPSAIPMTPVAHYHKVDRWYRPDPHNSCTTSDCHGLLPHMKKKEIRAFANLHTTFTDCMVCHDETIVDPARIVWLNKSTGEPQEPPAALLMMRELEMSASDASSQPSVVHEKVVNLFDVILQEAGGNPELEYLSARIRASEPGSPVWQGAIAALRGALPGYARGEYAAKLVLDRDRTDARQENKRLGKLTREYLAAEPDGEEQKRINSEIHKRVLADPAACLACHGDRPSRLDYEKLGYWPSRRDALQNLAAARLIQQNRRGGVFYMPGVLDKPASRPAKGE